MTVKELNAKIGEAMFKIQEIANSLAIENKKGNLESLCNLLPVYYTRDASMFDCTSFSHYPITYIKDESNVRHALVGLSDMPFDDLLNRFKEHYAISDDNKFQIWLNLMRTNIYISNDTYHSINLKRGDYYGYLGGIEELIRLMYFYNLDIPEIEFVTYSDISDSKSNVILAYKTKEGWCGGSHRAFSHFKVGDSIDLDKFKVLVSHGWIEGCEGYEKEKDEIDEIKKLADDTGIIKIKDNEIAKKLAIRLSTATG